MSYGTIYRPADLLRLARLYNVATGKSLRWIGARAAGQTVFFRRLEQGHDCTVETADEASRWFRAQWPANGWWPADLPRD
jgi:hypothetical protein